MPENAKKLMQPLKGENPRIRPGTNGKALPGKMRNNCQGIKKKLETNVDRSKDCSKKLGENKRSIWAVAPY